MPGVGWLPELCRRLPIWRDYYRNIGGASAGYCSAILASSEMVARPAYRCVPNGGNIADDRWGPGGAETENDRQRQLVERGVSDPDKER